MNNTITQTISDSQMSQLNELAHKLNRLGLNVFVLDPAGHAVLQMQTDIRHSDLDQIKQQMQSATEADGKPYWPAESLLVYPIRENDSLLLTLAIDSQAEEKTSQHEKDYLLCIVEDFVHRFNTGDKVLAQIDKIGNELSKAYEEIMLMYNLSTNMKVTQSSSSYLQMACDQLTQLVQVEGIAIFVERSIDGRKQLALSAGSGVITIDPAQADILQMNLISELHDGKEALLDSTEDGPFKYNWPEAVRNLITVPLGTEERMFGFLVATNIQNKPDFDTTDIKLFNSVANQCMVFIENNRLFDELKELFIGSLKALTNSIDAKDQYTRGHSERVAFISRWIAEHLAKTQPITEDEIHKIYLAGLLHDIGKIGVSEAVLRKQGRLTDDEHKMIQTHPGIGGSILAEIQQMKDVMPGVMGHHERLDGKGYPNGLSGDEIPLVARIVSLADAFDAMTSKRVYRDAMSIRRALAEIEKGIGTQFDEDVARAFLDSDIDKLWKIIQDGFIESWDYSNFDEYGADAVGALIR
jgi:HD-GYP domain-containing protein (c-di-GMP phosphodiesterase class II)